MNTVRKKCGVFLVGAAISERYDGDGVLPGLRDARCSLRDLVVRTGSEFVPGKIRECDDQQGDDRLVQFLPGCRGDGSVGIDGLFSSQTFRGHFEGPGKNHGDGKTKYENKNHTGLKPLG